MFVVAVQGCAPGLGRTLRINDIPENPDSAVGTDLHGLVVVRIDTFRDARGEPAIGTIQGRALYPQGDIGEIVRAEFADELTQKGATVTGQGGVLVQGRVLQWHVDVRPGFPASSAEAYAAIEIEVFNEYNELVYRGQYTGDTALRHPFMSQQRVERTLGSAMGYAVAEALRDQGLTDALNRHSPGRVG